MRFTLTSFLAINDSKKLLAFLDLGALILLVVLRMAHHLDFEEQVLL